MVEWLTPRTLDVEVRGSSLARRVVSLGKELYSTGTLLCLSSLRCINGYQQHTAEGHPCDGLTSRPGGSSNTPRWLILRKPDTG